MEIQIKKVTAHTTFEATDNGIVMSGSYDNDGSRGNQLTYLYATCQHAQGGNNSAGEVTVNLQGQQLRYTYGNVADDDFDAIRAIAKAVVAAASPAPAEEGGEA